MKPVCREDDHNQENPCEISDAPHAPAADSVDEPIVAKEEDEPEILTENAVDPESGPNEKKSHIDDEIMSLDALDLECRQVGDEDLDNRSNESIPVDAVEDDDSMICTITSNTTDDTLAPDLELGEIIILESHYR
mmetsp:Transcript_3358/g.7508  ORF Transcript_3358/g.7508 Transcript_3358/m.7508 type:complete len:135 (+) Transcript_3358:2414-2818(+)